VEIKAIDPPQSVKDAMEKQMRAEREKRAAILNAEGVRQSQILTADGDKQGNILRAEGDKQGAILRAEGQAQAIATVFQSIHDNDPDPKLLAYQYLQTLPQLAQGPGNTVWMVPSELTSALKALSSAFDPAGGGGDAPGVNGLGPDGRQARPRRASLPGQAPGVAAGAAAREVAAAEEQAAKEVAAAEDAVAAAELPGVPGAPVLGQAEKAGQDGPAARTELTGGAETADPG
jgi:hypothetical protein